MTRRIDWVRFKNMEEKIKSEVHTDNTFSQIRKENKSNNLSINKSKKFGLVKENEKD
jgi:hypothetical protein